MKNHALFSLKDKSKKLKCRLLQFLFCALRVNVKEITHSNIRISHCDYPYYIKLMYNKYY